MIWGLLCDLAHWLDDIETPRQVKRGGYRDTEQWHRWEQECRLDYRGPTPPNPGDHFGG